MRPIQRKAAGMKKRGLLCCTEKKKDLREDALLLLLGFFVHFVGRKDLIHSGGNQKTKSFDLIHR